MSPFFSDVFAGWAEETTHGTGVSPSKFARVYDGSYVKALRPREARAVLERGVVSGHFDKLHAGEGKLLLPLTPEGLLELIKHCNRQAPVTTGASPYDHTYKVPPDSDPLAGKGLSVEVHQAMPDTDLESFKGTGGVVTEWGIEARYNEEQKLDADLSFKDVLQVQKSAAPTYPDLDTGWILPEHITVEIDSSSSEVMAVAFRVNNNRRTDRGFLGSANIAEQLQAAGPKTITGQIDKEWENKTLYDKFLSGASAAVVVTAQISANAKLVWTLPDIVFTGETPAPAVAGAMEQALPFEARYDDTLATPFQLVVTNTQATVA